MPRADYGNRGLDQRQRGNAAQLLEKYRNMARDATLQGDRVTAEYYFQYADHYYRVLNENRPRAEVERQQRADWDRDFDNGDAQGARPDGGARDDDRDDRDADDSGARYSLDGDNSARAAAPNYEDGGRQRFDNGGRAAGSGNERPRERDDRTRGQPMRRDEPLRGDGRRDEPRRDEPRNEDVRRDDARRTEPRRDAPPRDVRASDDAIDPFRREPARRAPERGLRPDDDANGAGEIIADLLPPAIGRSGEASGEASGDTVTKPIRRPRVVRQTDGAKTISTSEETGEPKRPRRKRTLPAGDVEAPLEEV